MKPSKIPTERLKFFKDLYSDACQRASAELDAFERYRAQYTTGRVSNGAKNTPVVRNITYELIESEVSTDIPMPRVTPCRRDGEREKYALAVEQLCRNVRDSLDMEKLNDIDERYTYVLGGSVFLCEWDGERGCPVISCISPESFIPEPGVTEIEHMNYCFIVASRSAEDIEKSFGVRVRTGPAEETPQVIICYWKNDLGEVCRYIFTGDTELCDEENYYARRDANGEPVTHELLDGEKTDGKVLPRAGLAYYIPKQFPIAIRRNISKPGSLFGQSDCRIISTQQDAINRIESRIYQKLIRSAVMPYMPDDCRITPTNSVFGEVIHIDPSDTASKFGIIDTTPDIKQDVEQSDRLYEHARRLLGITDSYTGESDSGASSGYAISLKVSQSAGRLRSRRVMKNALYAELDKIIFGLYLAFCDERIPLGYTDVFGARHGIEFSRYDFIVYDEASGEWRYDDGYMFSADRSLPSESQDTESLREATLSFYKEGLFGDPDSDMARRLCWARLETLGYPDAHSLAAVFDKSGSGEGAKV